MPNSKQIVYLSQAQYAELIANGSITVNGVTVEYNENDLYVTPQAEPVTDVRVNGASISSNGIANIPLTSLEGTGLVKLSYDSGTPFKLNSNGTLDIKNPTDAEIKAGTSPTRISRVNNQYKSTFYGLAKAAGDSTQSASSNAVGTYTDDAKQKIQNMLGITDLLSTEETTTATAAHAPNSIFLMGGKLYKATAAIAIGDAVVEGTNCEVVKADEVFVKRTDKADADTLGLVKVGTGGTGVYLTSQGVLAVSSANSENSIKSGISGSSYVPVAYQHYSVFYGLSKLAGVDLANETVTLGTYPETSKTAIRSLIGAAAASDVTVSDVQVNGTSILSNGTAAIPVAGVGVYGVIKSDAPYGVYVGTDGYLRTSSATSEIIKAGENNFRTIKPGNQHEATFYGLAKVAGADEKNSTLSVGTYTDNAKSAIRNMLGAASTNIVAVQDEQPTDTDTKVWLPETQAAGVEVPTYAEFQALDSAVVKKTDIATSSTAGIVKVDSGYGITITSGGSIATYPASSGTIKAGGDGKRPIVPLLQHESTFYGLAKAAGDSTQSASDNAVGTYTADASAAIRSMLGAVGDVQINGTSVISNGTAEIPTANNIRYGVVKVNTADGVYITGDGTLAPTQATDANYHDGISNYRVVTPYGQHQAVFYGLAKAAGDTTMASSSNAVGTYTAEAKSAIQSMLGIDLQSIAAEVEIPLVETVSGTTPIISGQPNTRYVCGEVSTLSITPPSAGSIDVIFDSGSTPTVITVPNTVRWPAWFDTTALEADTTYEILITDGVYGSVMTWAN